MYKKTARYTLFVLSLLSVFFLFAASQLRFDYNFENFFPTGDEDLEFFLDYREEFENDNDYLLIGIRNHEGIFQQEFLQKVARITEKIDSLPLSEEVLSITNLQNPVIGPFGLLQVPVLRLDEPEHYPQDSLHVYQNESLVGTLVASEIPAISILLKHKEMISKKEADQLMKEVDTILGAYSLDELHVAGKAKAQAVYVRKMQEELVIFASASVVLVVIFLSLAYRSYWGVWVPLVVVLLAAIWICGIMSLSGKSLDVMMVLLPTIIFVVGMSDVVHILTKYIEELRNGHHKIRAIKITMKEVGLATFLTSLTTAVGFLTLLTASVKPIREFGLYTAIGVFVAFILAFTLLPSIMVLMKKPKVVKRQKNKLLWTHTLGKLFLWVLRNRLKVLAVAGMVIAGSLYGISQIQINTFLLEDIRDNDPLKQDFFFFDQHFGGSKPFEMAIMVQDSTYGLYDEAVLREISKMENYLRQEYGVANIVSPTFVVKSAHKALNGGVHTYFRLPEDEKAYARIRQLIRRFSAGNTSLPVSSENQQVGRISGKMADIGSQLSRQQNLKLERFMAKNINTELVKFRLTGTSLLIDKNAQHIIGNMLEGLGIAFVVVAFIAGILFRSVRMLIVTLIPNLIPLLMIAGLMGIFGVYLKLSTSIIFTIAFGIAVDDTIHFISKLRIELNKGKSLIYAIKHTFLYTGKAIIITTLILAGGFLTLILSSFGGTFYTGLLVSLTLIFAVVADLALLPVLLILMFRKSPKKVKKAAKPIPA